MALTMWQITHHSNMTWWKAVYYCLVIYLVSSTDQIYLLTASRLGDKFDRSMTLGKLLDNNAQLVIFIS